MNAEEIKLVNKEVKRMLQKRSIQKVYYCLEEFISFVFSRQNTWHEGTCHKFEDLKCLFPLSALQDGRFTSYKGHVAGREFMCK